MGASAATKDKLISSRTRAPTPATEGSRGGRTDGGGGLGLAPQATQVATPPLAARRTGEGGGGAGGGGGGLGGGGFGGGGAGAV